MIERYFKVSSSNLIRHATLLSIYGVMFFPHLKGNVFLLVPDIITGVTGGLEYILKFKTPLKVVEVYANENLLKRLEG